MATYIDRSRKTEVTASIASNLRVHVYPSDIPVPDALDQYGPIVGALTFGSNQQSASILIYGWGSTSSFGSSTWSWQVRAGITTDNGFGATNTVTLVLQSGTGTSANALTGISVNVGALNIDWTGTVDESTVYWDINQSAFSGVSTDYPDITYNSYEKSNIGGTATAKVVINGLMTQATGTVSSQSDMTWDLRLGLNMLNNTTGAQTLNVSPGLCNGVSMVSSVPSYIHVALGQTATATQYLVTGDGNTFPNSYITGQTNFTLRRLLRLKGAIRAYNLSYYDDLQCRINGFDVGGLGYRDITATSGAFQEDGAFLLNSVNTTLRSWTGTSYDTDTKTQSQNTIPSTVSADIKASSLTALGDDSSNTRLLFRGWWFPGASVIQADSVNISVGVTTDLRTFTGQGIGLNSYRYMSVQIRSLDGTTRSGTISIATQPTGAVKSWTVSTNSTTFVKVYIDLCSPQNVSSTIDETDHPYPRMNPSDPTNVAQAVDGDYWGITRATSIQFTHISMQMGDVKLEVYPTDTDYTKGYWCPTHTWNKQMFTTFGGNTITTNRLYQGDCQGNSMTEEGWAVSQTSPASNTLWTITDFVNAMNATDGTVKRHQGYTASASTAYTSPSYIRNGYANSVNGHAYWLGGTTFRKVGGASEVKHWVETDQSDNGPEASVYAQTYFRSINGNFVPDMLDVFEQGDAGDLWMTIGAVSYQRGRSHGLVLNQNATPGELQTVQLTLDSDGSVRGTGVSDLLGRYYTAQPMGLGTKNHNTICLALNTFDPDPLYTNKSYRAVFKVPPPAGTAISADRNPLYQHFYMTVSAGTVSLWKANGPLGTDYVEQVTPITGVITGHMRCLHTDTLLGICIVCQMTAGGIQKFYTTDYGVSTVATVINATGSKPALAIDPHGKEIYIWRTSGGNIESKILDSSGAVLMATTTVVTGSVADDAIDVYERLDDLFIVYNNTSTGITVVRSTDGGRTYL